MAKGGEELVRRGYNGSQELASHKYFLQAARASGDPYNAVVNYGAPTLEQFGYKTKAGNSRRKMAAYTSSGNRLYVPMGILPAFDIIFNKAMVIYNAKFYYLGVLQSRMNMVWLRSIGGKLKTDYSYSNTLVYNTFPVPEFSTRRKNEIEDLVWKILDIRDEEGGTLAELYGSPLAAKNPKPMNSRLKAAHEELDRVVDRAYRDRPFKDDNERLALLLDMYSKKVSGNDK
uniref:type IIL restriction-modification enzyme MmeI n=1 Tax=Lentilactobacillus hilgardii TaxID=1588 RepID=UPI00403F0042